MDKAFYNTSYSAQRTFADMLTLLNTSPLGLQSAGVAADSATRLIGDPPRQGRAGLGRRTAPTLRATDNLNYQANIDFTPSSSGTGNSLTLGVFGGYVHVQPTGGGVQMLTRTPAQTGEAGGVVDVGVAPALELLLVRRAVADDARRLRFSSSRRRRISTIPTGTVRVASQLPDGTTSIKTLSFGGGSPPSEVVERRGAADEPAAVVQQQQQAHDQGDVERLARAQHVGRRARRSGTFSFNSLADLEAGRPASYTRTLSSIHFPSDQLTAGVSIGDAWRPTSTVQVQYGVRADANRFLFQSDVQPAVRDDVRHSQRRRAESRQLQPARRPAVDLRHRADDRVRAGRGTSAARGDSCRRRHLSECWSGEPALERGEPDGLAELHADDRVRRPGGARAQLGGYTTDPASTPSVCADSTHGRDLLECVAERVGVRPRFRAAALVAHGGRLVGAGARQPFRARPPGRVFLEHESAGHRRREPRRGPRPSSLGSEDRRPVYRRSGVDRSGDGHDRDRESSRNHAEFRNVATNKSRTSIRGRPSWWSSSCR